MQIEKKADIKENDIKQLDTELLAILLKDRSSGKNILWATDNYCSKGLSYAPSCPITVKQISGKFGKVIRPRIDKSKKEQEKRIKDKAEVFTPSWICCRQNSAADEDWFGQKDVFNTPNGQSWITNQNHIEFPEGKTWQDYVKSKRLEITCGEAPYLCSRYDTTTGKWIEVADRIGILDRKIRVINENVTTEKDWYDWVIEAYKATYGYEWQGDSVLIARENMLYSFIDYYVDRFGIYPIKEYLFEIAKILSWNIWQMDGLKYVIPYSCQPIKPLQISLFEDFEKPKPCPGCEKNNPNLHTGIYCKIMNWQTKRAINFVNLRGAKNMKFDYVIGNPPYNMEAQKTSTSDDPVFHLFMDASYNIGSKVILITPARFLMNAGKTPTSWNQKMLNSNHIKVEYYERDSGKVFNNISIPGGVAVTYFDKDKEYAPIIQFIDIKELRSINEKVSSKCSQTLDSIIYTQSKFNLNNLYADYPEMKNQIGSDGADKRFRQIIMERFPNIFVDKYFEGSYRVFGLIAKNRCYRYISKKYVEEISWINKYKVLVPFSNGSILSDKPEVIIGKPVIGEINDCFTQTFLGIGEFDNRYEAESLKKYISTKFARIMLSILKITQGNKADTWARVPIQDFSNNSDIDWNKTIQEIDSQLYKKYALSQEEIDFIESHVKEME